MVRSPNDNVLSVTLSEHCGLLTAQIGLGHDVCVISVGYALFERAAVSRAVPYRRLSVGIGLQLKSPQISNGSARISRFTRFCPPYINKWAK
jgi:hypothetical protein